MRARARLGLHWRQYGCGTLLGLALILGGERPLLAASPQQGQLVAADTAFAFRLVKELAREHPSQNVFIAPYSVSTVLQMLWNGAAGATREEMTRVLGINNLQVRALNQDYEDLQSSLRSAEAEVTLAIANSIWYSVGVQLEPQFIASNRDFFGATLEAADFTDPRTAGIVNRWADENTKGRIRKIIEGRLPGDTKMILANAIYFKGTWQRQFDAKATRQEPFHLSESRQQQVPMMRQSGRFQYYDGKSCQAVRLPYKGGRLGMFVLLPKPGSSVTKLLTTLDEQMWRNKIVPVLRSCKGTVVLPRFKLEYGAELKPALQAIGLKLPFSSAADFSAMSRKPLLLNAVKHKAFVSVNEEGTEAAAVTVGVMTPSSIDLNKPFEMIVNRPFLFIIADDVTGATLFVGTVFDPASDG